MLRLITILLSLLLIANLGHAEPVEHKPPNASYQPAFEGQTRAPGIRTEEAYEVRILSRELHRPWGLAPLPDGRFLITQREGSLVIVDAQGKPGLPITDGLPEVDARGQGGLLDVALAADYAQSGIIYLSYSVKDPQGSLTALGRGQLDEQLGRLQDFELLYQALPMMRTDAHYGSRIAVVDQDSLYLSTGDRWEARSRMLSQQADTGLGKVIRVTGLTGQPEAQVWSMGHRNPQGLALEPGTGRLFLAEMGPMGGDEINLIQEGGNYGWPVIGYGLEYSGDKVGEGITQREGMLQPMYYWDPSISPSGIAFVQSDAIPSWQGNLFVGCLSGQHIARLVIEGDRVTGEERLLEGEGQRFRDLQEGVDGALYAVTDAGRLYRIGKPVD